MPRQKDLKRLVRTRMQKTGESYTAARAQIARKVTKKPTSVKTDYAALAGMSDDKLKQATGCTWERWVKALDHYGAAEMSHRDIARLVKARYQTPDWWTQTVTVGYERIKGLRARGQQRDGSYRMSKSRTFNVAVTQLYDHFADAKLRRKWLAEKGVKIRSATAPKALRMQLSDGSVVIVGFVAKAAGKSSVAVEHTKLSDSASAERLKDAWSQHFAALQAVLT